MEASIRSAAQDSSSDTRAIGRSMYAAYARAMPLRAEAFLRRMDTALQEKLSQATLTYIPGRFVGLHAQCISLGRQGHVCAHGDMHVLKPCRALRCIFQQTSADCAGAHLNPSRCIGLALRLDAASMCLR